MKDKDHKTYQAGEYIEENTIKENETQWKTTRIARKRQQQ